MFLEDSMAGLEEWENQLAVRRAQADGGELKNFRRGWCQGGETFRQEWLEQANRRAGDSRVEKLRLEPEEQNEFKLEGNQDCPLLWIEWISCQSFWHLHLTPWLVAPGVGVCNRKSSQLLSVSAPSGTRATL